MTLIKKFEKFHDNNPHVYELFNKFTTEAIGHGKKKLSAWLIINRIRWETEIVTQSEDMYKISNDFIALYARKFITENPKYGSIFNIKEMKRL